MIYTEKIYVDMLLRCTMYNDYVGETERCRNARNARKTNFNVLFARYSQNAVLHHQTYARLSLPCFILFLRNF